MYGKRIKELREEKQMTQTQLAEVLNTTQKSISKYELEHIDISTEMLINLCKFFNVTSDYILGLNDDITNNINIKNYDQRHNNGMIINK